jgi:hypothetical protein
VSIFDKTEPKTGMKYRWIMPDEYNLIYDVSYDDLCKFVDKTKRPLSYSLEHLSHEEQQRIGTKNILKNWPRLFAVWGFEILRELGYYKRDKKHNYYKGQSILWEVDLKSYPKQYSYLRKQYCVMPSIKKIVKPDTYEHFGDIFDRLD